MLTVFPKKKGLAIRGKLPVELVLLLHTLCRADLVLSALVAAPEDLEDIYMCKYNTPLCLIPSNPTET